MELFRSLVLLFFLGFPALNAWAQKDSIPMVELDQVLIRLPAPSSATIIARPGDPWMVDTISLKHMQARNLSDLLGRTSGIFVKNYGPANVSAITMRGMSASQTRITWNGLDLNSPMYGMADLNLIPVGVFTDAHVSPSGNGIGGTLDLFSYPREDNSS